MAPRSSKHIDHAVALYTSLIQLESPLEREELDPLVEYIRSLDDTQVTGVIKRVVTDKQALRKKYNTNVEKAPTEKAKRPTRKGASNKNTTDKENEETNTKHTDNHDAESTATTPTLTTPIPIPKIVRNEKKVREYCIQVVLNLLSDTLQQPAVDPLPPQRINDIVLLIQDVSFLILPLPTGIVNFLENFLIHYYLTNLPNTLREIYKALEISKPTQLKKPKTKENTLPLLFELPPSSPSSTPSSSNPTTDGPTTKKRKVEPEIKDSKLSELLNTKFSAKSLNHFTSGLTNVKAFMGKQTKETSQTTSARASRARARQESGPKKEWKMV